MCSSIGAERGKLPNSPSHLISPDASFPSPDKRRVRQQRNRVEGPRCKVGSHWADDDKDHSFTWPRHAEGRLEDEREDGSFGAGVNVHNISFSDAKAHLNSYEGGSDVEAGVLGIGNPLLVHLHQLPDALQQFTFVKQLQEDKDSNCQLVVFFFTALFPSCFTLFMFYFGKKCSLWCET